MTPPVAELPTTLADAHALILAECLASFKVKSEKVLTTIDWKLATGANTATSCSAGDLLRERPFVEGSYAKRRRRNGGARAVSS
ncbi:hypothetical protein ACVJGD_000301 [Bradyrhizobium sp. USDA 10063]